MDTNELLGMMASDASPSEVHDAIKTVLYQKSSEKVDQLTPSVAKGIFGDAEEPVEGEVEEPVAAAVEPEQEQQEEE
tara:strand:- start:1874 stop:2104 length:231 start_codon:yes stop_codon:yes gene_type:complete